MISSNGNITNYVQFLKLYNKSDMSDSVYNQNIDIIYDTNNDFGYEFYLKQSTTATDIIDNNLLNIIDNPIMLQKAFSNGFDNGFN